jgi:hypothetical protein
MFFLLGLPFVLFVASVGVNFYIVLFDLDRFLECFKKSTIISSYASVWGRGSFYARYTLVYIVIGSVMFPNKHMRNGTLDPEEMARCPVEIKYRMALSFYLLLSAAVCFSFTALLLIFMKNF